MNLLELARQKPFLHVTQTSPIAAVVPEMWANTYVLKIAKKKEKEKVLNMIKEITHKLKVSLNFDG